MKMPDAAERKVLMITTFVSGCIALAPQEWVSAGILLGASVVMFGTERRLTKREKAASATPIAAAEAPPAETDAPSAEAASIALDAEPVAAEAAPRAEPAPPPPPAV
jgi:hypothetical protein